MRKIAGFIAGAAFALAAMVVPAHAALLGPNADGLSLDTDPTTFYQQTAASPCVIGGNNCLNGDFDYTLAGSGGSIFDVDSPFYAVGDITALIGGSNAFTIGLDYNQTVNAQTLYSFSAVYFDAGGVIGSQTWTGPTVLQVNNQGVGFSDFLLLGFVIPEGTTNVQFSANWFNNDGPDRYFIIGAEATVCDPTIPGDCPEVVPEPSLLALLSLTALGAGAIRRRVGC
jgi:hypothetical protein